MSHVTSPDLETRPAFRVAKAISVLDRARRAAEARASLGVAEQRLLWLFRDGTPRTLRDVAETLGLEQSTVNRQVNGALSTGLLRRYREDGQTAQLLEATDDGLDRFSSDLTEGLARIDAALDVVPAGRRDTFLDDLLAFANAYDEVTHGAT